MKMPRPLPLTNAAILTLAETKAAVEAFDRGDSNVLHALDAVVAAVEAYLATADEHVKPDRRARDAA